MQQKVISSILVGLIGSLLIEISFLVIFYSFIPRLSDGSGIFLYIILILCLAPVIIACIGALYLKAACRYGLAYLDCLILPETSSIIATALGMVIFFMVSSLVPPVHGLSDYYTSGFAYFIESIIGLFSNPIAIFAIIVYSQCSLIGSIIYKKLLLKI